MCWHVTCVEIHFFLWLGYVIRHYAELSATQNAEQYNAYSEQIKRFDYTRMLWRQ